MNACIKEQPLQNVSKYLSQNVIELHLFRLGVKATFATIEVHLLRVLIIFVSLLWFRYMMDSEAAAPLTLYMLEVLYSAQLYPKTDHVKYF